jgi:hypothetical protein
LVPALVFFIFNSNSGNSFQKLCHVSVVDTGARAGIESCSSSFEGEADGVVNEAYLRRIWAPSNGSDVSFNQPQILQRLFRAAHASTLKDGVIMGPSYWDTAEEQVVLAKHRVHCAGGGGPCPALGSGWVLGAAAWDQRVQFPLKNTIFIGAHMCNNATQDDATEVSSAEMPWPAKISACVYQHKVKTAVGGDTVCSATRAIIR